MNPIPKLLHIANSYPHAIDKERFYAMKARILKRWAKPDGYDVQHFEGKTCWRCNGTGFEDDSYFDPDWDDCWKCGGCGWFKPPVWIVLDRYRFGKFVFHTPAERVYEKPETPSQTKTIYGLVSHRDYGYRKPAYAALALGMIFDWGLVRIAIRDRVGRCKIAQQYKRWKAEQDKKRCDQTKIFVDEEVPF